MEVKLQILLLIYFVICQYEYSILTSVFLFRSISPYICEYPYFRNCVNNYFYFYYFFILFPFLVLKQIIFQKTYSCNTMQEW